MADRLQLEIVTPAQRVVAEEVDEVIVPAEDGYLGVRAGHAPMLLRLGVGQLTYRLDGKPHVLAISGGYAEVTRTGMAVLAETCEPAETVDVERANRAKERAERRLSGSDSDSDHQRAEVSLKRAMNRISAHTHVRSMMGA